MIDCDAAKEICSGSKCNGYRGKQTKTQSGRTCQRWDAKLPHVHAYQPALFPLEGLADNYCRNPDGSRTIWCYTTDVGKRWEYCDPMPCPAATVSPGATITIWWR